jgi:2,4-dienoyl-CoA reductase-like NADH-dependent reductase (Old Yellow Enzyme family)
MSSAERIINEVAAPLFTPLTIGNVTLPNRIVMAPMTRSFSPNGVPGDDVAAYYQRRAEGGVGLIITEGVGVDHPSALGEAGLGETNIPVLNGDAALAGWKHVVERVHAAGGIIFPQLWHMGVMKEQGTGLFPDAPPMRPSGLWGPTDRQSSLDRDYIARVATPTQPMSESDIADVIAAYARSAANAKAVGFDGIAIHAAHGYLIDTFLWEETNRRNDEWGGDRVRRTRFAVEVVKAIRAAIGPDMPIVFRFSQWKQQDFKAKLGHTPEELGEVLGPISDAGVDVFDGSQRYFDRAEFDGSSLNLGGWAQKLTGKPGMTVGGVGVNKGLYDSRRDGGAAASNNIPLLMQRFNRGEFALVGVGRALLHDPKWVLKLRSGEPLPDYDEASMNTLT